MRMSKIKRAKLLQSTEQALVVGLLKAPTQTSAVCRLCCRRSYRERGHHFQLIMHHVCEFRMHSWNPSSCFLRDASSLIDADSQVSAITYKCASWTGLVPKVYKRPPLN